MPTSNFALKCWVLQTIVYSMLDIWEHLYLREDNYLTFSLPTEVLISGNGTSFHQCAQVETLQATLDLVFFQTSTPAHQIIHLSFRTNWNTVSTTLTLVQTTLFLTWTITIASPKGSSYLHFCPIYDPSSTQLSNDPSKIWIILLLKSLQRYITLKISNPLLRFIASDKG